jgi:molybdopterin-guanine dinucleotide biosynthesis protein A
MIERQAMAGVILAGGRSRRMGGGDKGLLQLGPETMLAHVIAGLRPQVAALALNANGDPARFRAFRLDVVADPVGGFVGPLAGILAGLRWAARRVPDATHVLSASVDTPFLPADLGHRLARGLAAAAGSEIALGQSAGVVHPVIGLWPVALADDLDLALRGGRRKVLEWADRHGAIRVPFEPVSVAGQMVDPFFNANTPDDFAVARRLIEGHAR